MKKILNESHLGNANFSMETLTLKAFQFFTSGRRSFCSRDEPIRSGRRLKDFGRVPRHDPLRPADHVPVAGDAQERQTITVQVILIPKFLIKKFTLSITDFDEGYLDSAGRKSCCFTKCLKIQLVSKLFGD
jgi:hypothetical protein